MFPDEVFFIVVDEVDIFHSGGGTWYGREWWNFRQTSFSSNGAGLACSRGNAQPKQNHMIKTRCQYSWLHNERDLPEQQCSSFLLWLRDGFGWTPDNLRYTMESQHFWVGFMIISHHGIADHNDVSKTRNCLFNPASKSPCHHATSRSEDHTALPHQVSRIWNN